MFPSLTREEAFNRKGRKEKAAKDAKKGKIEVRLIMCPAEREGR
jgi:hypothetical protein